MTTPVLPPRQRRGVTVYMNDATLDKLDSLVAVLPDVPNRSRLIEDFVELQIALLLDPAMALGPFIEGILDNMTREALAEISEWRVPDLETETV